MCWRRMASRRSTSPDDAAVACSGCASRVTTTLEMPVDPFSLLLIVAAGAGFYFLIIRPGKQRQQAQQAPSGSSSYVAGAAH